jgi:outer membrane protein OmpA-like peptidoglycan-associated protein
MPLKGLLSLKTLLSLAILLGFLAFAGPARGQGFQGGAARLTLDASTGTMTLSFGLSAASLASGDDRLTLTPVLESDGAVAMFPPVVVEGRRARVSRERKERSGRLAPDATATYLAAGMTHQYEATIAGQEAAAWGGSTARLSLRALNEHCDCEVEVAARDAAITMLELSLAIVNVPAPVVVTPEEAVVVAPVAPPACPRAALDSIAAPYPFATPVTALERELLAGTVSAAEIERYIDEHRGGSITIYFGVTDIDISPALGDNARSLETLLEAIRALEAAPGKTRVRVLVGGFASPEGSNQLNDWLADARANALRDYLVARSPLTIKDVLVHGVGADWRGLRALVAESRMPGRVDVLRVIDTYPVWNPRTQVGRLTTLRNLDGGKPYRYLLEKFFPKLRSAAFIKVFYENVD